MEQQTCPLLHEGQTQLVPPSDDPPEPLPFPLLLPDMPLEDPLDPPEELPIPPLDDDETPLDEPLPDPPPLELELLVAAHSLAQCAVVQAISLSPAPSSATVQPHAPVQVDMELPRSRQPA